MKQDEKKNQPDEAQKPEMLSMDELETISGGVSPSLIGKLREKQQEASAYTRFFSDAAK